MKKYFLITESNDGISAIELSTERRAATRIAKNIYWNLPRRERIKVINMFCGKYPIDKSGEPILQVLPDSVEQYISGGKAVLTYGL